MKTFVRFLYLPFKRYSIFLYAMAILLFLPAYFWNVANVAKEYLAIRIINLASFSLLNSYAVIFVSCVISKYSKILAKIWICITYALIFLVSFGETFMIKFFQTRYSAFIFQLLDETIGRESREFVSAYCSTFKFFAIVTLYVIILSFGAILLQHLLNKDKRLKAVPRILATLAFCCFCATLAFSAPEVSGKEVCKDRQFPIYEDSFSYLINAQKNFNVAKKECISCNEMHRDIQVDSCSYSSPKIVLFIGESYNRHHSSLYGYNLNTNPLISQLDSLYVFTDVITSVNGTSYSFHNFMSLSSVDEDKSWAESPLFMAFFKACGYYVTFYSNQFPKRFHKDSFDFEGSYFLDMPLVDSKCFDFRNTEVYEYDGDLIDHFVKDSANVNKGEYDLTIIHFMGQHMLPETKYPSSFAYFTADSISRTDLNEAQRAEVAYYDNATRYNDYVTRRVIDLYQGQDVIFVYFADHGDEANDFRIHRGRSFDIQTGAPMLHCQMDIPFWIYATPEYRAKHPEVIDKLKKSLDRPFMTDDLPHFMFDLAGIHTPWFKPERSLINEKFNAKRKRMVGYVTRYDYDEICGNKIIQNE